MIYHNPVIPGFYPDPSVCTDGKKFYLVCSSFQYFPGVPLFESDDLVNWRQIGHVLTRGSQLPLAHAVHSAGIFAPTLRYHDGTFYMITTNVSDGGNFIVHTNDIYGEWSEPARVAEQGIDPSLLFADGKCYFTGNGEDEDGRGGIFVCEMDPMTGQSLTKARCVWHGTGGRYLEGPHLYKIGDTYYILAAEGGTEYGHMEICAKSDSPYGPFESCPFNPILTNRNLGGYQIQGTGHADLVRDANGGWWAVHLAFRQTDRWLMYHITGRETYLEPVTFDADGWPHMGADGTARLTVETDRPGELAHPAEFRETFENTRLGKEWVFVRNPNPACYSFSDGCLVLTGGAASNWDTLGTATMALIRQREMYGSVRVRMELAGGEAGLSVYMDECHHYDVCMREGQDGEYEILLRLCIGDVRHEQIRIPAAKTIAEITVGLTPQRYDFAVSSGGVRTELGSAETRYLSTEVASGFTGVMFGLYAEPGGSAYFNDFEALMVRENPKM